MKIDWNSSMNTIQELAGPFACTARRSKARAPRRAADLRHLPRALEGGYQELLRRSDGASNDVAGPDFLATLLKLKRLKNHRACARSHRSNQKVGPRALRPCLREHRLPRAGRPVQQNVVRFEGRWRQGLGAGALLDEAPVLVGPDETLLEGQLRGA
jgi:hypothetical protein